LVDEHKKLEKDRQEAKEKLELKQQQKEINLAETKRNSINRAEQNKIIEITKILINNFKEKNMFKKANIIKIPMLVIDSLKKTDRFQEEKN